jgi:hypothetical protein
MAQRLAGRLASLNKFILRSIEWGLSFFEVLKSAKGLLVGTFSAASLWRAEELSNKAENALPTFARGSSIAISINFAV